MIPDQRSAYDVFLRTGKIDDYLYYIHQKQQVTNTAGETIAYHDGRDCAAGAAD